jgi:hypothetical protein
MKDSHFYVPNYARVYGMEMSVTRLIASLEDNEKSSDCQCLFMA